MDTPLLYEKDAKDTLVKMYVEKYQFYRIDRPCFLKTIPNGRMECWKIFEGGFDIWNDQTNRFEESTSIGAYPATTNSLLFRIKEKLFCINVKLRLTAISTKTFKNFYPATVQIDDHIANKINALENIAIDSFFFENELNTSVLDSWLRPLFEKEEINSFIYKLIQIITTENIQTVSELSQKIGVNSKTIHRRTKMHFNLSPKELLSLFRFERTSAFLKSSFANQLTDALNFGYHDQPHFAHEAKRITGYSPRTLFNQMKLSTHDLILFEING